MAMKRPSPTSEVEDITEQPVKKAHRTHEENQERAYIAASRRTDRDIHHRLRSAKKASDCHRKRTGRGLKITYEAVLGDEQYESEEDDRPTRRYSMPTGSSASLTAGGAGAGLPNSSRAPSDHYDEIDALFAKSFPGVNLNPTWAAQQEQLQQRQQQQQQFQQRQPQPHTHRHSYSHPYTPANGTAPAPAAAAAAGSGYTPRFKQRAPAPVHTHLQPQPSLVHSPHSPDSPYSPHSPHSAVHTPLSAVTPMSAISAYPLPPAHGGGGDGGKHASGIPHPTNGHGLGAALALLPLGANNAYPLDVDAGGSNGSLDGSPMVGVGGGEEAYYYSASAGSPDSPMGFGGAGGALGGALGGGGMIDFAGVGAEAAWLAGVDDGVGGNAAGPTGGEGAFYARRLSLPSALDQFHFPGGFESATTAAAPVAPEAMIDPSFLSSAAAVAPVAMPAAEEDVGGGGGGAAAADAAEPSLKEWMAEWVDFDEEAKL